MKRYIAVRLGAKSGLSQLLDSRAVIVCSVLAVVALILLLVSAGTGNVRIPLDRTAGVLIGQGSAADSLIIVKLRLPRILTAFLVGAALAGSGAILQGMIRNPLASPDIMGLSGGASVAAVWFITINQKASIFWLPPIAFVGAAAMGWLVYMFAWKRGVTASRLVLIGVGIGAAAHALTTLLVVTSPMYLTAKALIWLTGSVYGSSWTHVYTLLPWFLVLLALSFVLARGVNAQQLGDDVAAGLGNPVQRSRLGLLLVSVGLAGSAVAVGGGIGFVGLIAPHLAKRLTGPSFGGALPAAVLIGGIVTAASDLFARTAFTPLDLPVGLFTALIGAPFFLYLLFRTRHQ